MATPPVPELSFEPVPETDLDVAHAIELEGYPSDEAATIDAFRYRQSVAPSLFLGAYTLSASSHARTLVGYVCSTLSTSSTLNHASMSTHEPSGTSVCIHSVAVSAAHRRKGVASALLREYISRLRAASDSGSGPQYERVLLIAHEELRPLYEGAGFEWIGPSSVVHGSKPWFEMRLDLRPSSNPQAVMPPPQDLLALLQQASSRPRPQSRLFASFPNGIDELADSTEPRTNKHDLLCPRPGCGSVILLKGVATLVSREPVPMEPPNQTHPMLPALGSPSPWWLVKPSPMAFENIGFSRPVSVPTAPQSSTQRPLKLLICAECDLGPLGWSEEGGTEFWLAASRVGYHA